MANKKETTADETIPPVPPTPQLAIYEVLVKSVKIGGVIAFRTARVNLTKEQADALNAAQPDTVKFIGV